MDADSRSPHAIGCTVVEVSGSVPAVTSCPSEKPSPSVSGLNGSVPNASSSALVKPSSSSSAIGLRTRKVFPAEIVAEDVPDEFVPMRVKVPIAFGLIVKAIVAVVPVPSMIGVPRVMAAGLKFGTKANVEPVRPSPVMARFGIVLSGIEIFGVIEVITGACITTKSVSEIAVAPTTVTDNGPVVAPEGTVTFRIVLVAEVTVAAVPLKSTVFSDVNVLNPLPWIVTFVPACPLEGVK